MGLCSKDVLEMRVSGSRSSGAGLYPYISGLVYRSQASQFSFDPADNPSLVRDLGMRSSTQRFFSQLLMHLRSLVNFFWRGK